MSERVTYRLSGSVATITMDDGKANALSSAMIADLGAALDRAAADRATVLLTGREGRFCGGFDLAVMRAGGAPAREMLIGGFELSARLLSFPTPVLIACTGHAVAMGSFLLLSGDVRIGADGPFKIVANEVAIGMTMPQAAIEICRQRLAPTHLTRVIATAEVYSPQDAVVAGFLDRVVPAGELAKVADETGDALSRLDMGAHAATKLRLRAESLKALRAAIDAEPAFL